MKVSADGKLRWSDEMEAQLAELLRTDPSPTMQSIDNARGYLSTLWGMPLSFSQIQQKRADLLKRGYLSYAPGVSAPVERTPALPPYDPAPVLTDAWELDEGEGWAIYGDDHGAHVDFDLIDMMCEEAEAMGIKRVLNGGDKWNGDAFSKHARVLPPTPFAQEKRTQRRLRARLERTFAEEYILSGNHDKWIPKKMDGSLSASDLEETFLHWYDAPRDGPVKWSVYGYATINSPKLGRIRITHPRNYSRTKAVVASKIAAKNKCHVLTFHEHQRGARQVETEDGDKWAISVGCTANWQEFAYVMLEDSTSPEMQQGFVLLKNGVFHLFGDDGYITSIGQLY